jgi:hypothetical protein
VVNTYLVWLRFQKMRGAFTAAEHDDEVDFVKAQLAAVGQEHWKQFVAAWQAG